MQSIFPAGKESQTDDIKIYFIILPRSSVFGVGFPARGIFTSEKPGTAHFYLIGITKI